MDYSLYSFVTELIAFLRIFFLLSLVVYFVLFILYADADLTLLFYHYLNRPRDFSNKVVWLIGASSGIGEHLVYDLAKLGAKLAISGGNVERLTAVAERCKEISNHGAEDILLVPFQIDDIEVHNDSLNKVLDHFGQIDILVNNAGITHQAKVPDDNLTVAQQFRHDDTSGLIHLNRQVLQHFLELNTGHIVATGTSFSSACTGSKQVLRQRYFEGLRGELVNENIDITLVYPGPVFSRQITDRDFNGQVKKEGDLQQDMAGKKMAAERYSDLMVTAIAYRLHECWISLQPFLLTFYIAQYFPTKYKEGFISFIKRFYFREA